MTAPATEVAARLDDLVDAVADLLAVDGAGLRLLDSGRRMRTVTRRGSLPTGDGGTVRSAPVVVREAFVGDLDAVDRHPGTWDDTRQAALQTLAVLVSDLLVLAVEDGPGAVAHLTDQLVDLDGGPA